MEVLKSSTAGGAGMAATAAREERGCREEERSRGCRGLETGARQMEKGKARASGARGVCVTDEA